MHLERYVHCTRVCSQYQTRGNPAGRRTTPQEGVQTAVSEDARAYSTHDDRGGHFVRGSGDERGIPPLRARRLHVCTRTAWRRYAVLPAAARFTSPVTGPKGRYLHAWMMSSLFRGLQSSQKNQALPNDTIERRAAEIGSSGSRRKLPESITDLVEAWLDSACPWQ